MHDCTQLMYLICLSEALILNDKNDIFLRISNSIISPHFIPASIMFFLQQNIVLKKPQDFYFKNQYTGTVTCAINSGLYKTKFDLC